MNFSKYCCSVFKLARYKVIRSLEDQDGCPVVDVNI